MHKEIYIETSKKQEIIDITDKIEKLVNITEGICMVYVPHATAAIMINESYDPKIMTDIIDALNLLIPQGKWKHDLVDNNGAAHIKAGIIGPSEQIPIIDGKLGLGRWQGIMLCDFDGPRKRKIIVSIK
ncbi:YjbQ family protein [Candidatus Woesearchaeota archaeon]|nr:YjbQ family protein [Candidatus Woesearchaeota archaeon]